MGTGLFGIQFWYVALKALVDSSHETAQWVLRRICWWTFELIRVRARDDVIIMVSRFEGASSSVVSQFPCLL